ncbi:hypothetical protein L9F63_020382, partial [Diploptera punctata]
SLKLLRRLGKLIGTRPVTFLLLSLAICVASSFGLTLWKEEVDEIQLFMPKDSEIRMDASWVEDNFRDELRFESVIVEADNVLTPHVLAAIADLETDVRKIVTSGHDWSDVCARYLTWFPNVNESSAISEIREYMEDFQDNCIYQSLLRIWTQNGTMEPIYKLDEEAIIKSVTNAVNSVRKKPGHKFTSALENIKPLLSGIRKDSKGYVIGAKATILNWILKKTNNWSPDWELEFIKTVLFSNRTLPPGVKIYAVTTRSYEDTLAQVLENNITLLSAGFSLIIIYVMIMLGRFNSVEQRLYLSLLGVSIVGQAIMASYGASFYMGFFWGPIHPVLPFLLLGIGVDNIFIIMQSLDNLKKEDRGEDVAERMGQVLRQAGVSITVTSLTDIVAFAVGTMTVMPFLRSFCVFASMGILFLYIFVILFFMSCLTIDERRLQQNRDGCTCIPQTNWKPNDCSKRDLQKEILKKYIGPVLMKTPVKVCVVYFPEYGKRAAVYLGNDINYYDDKDKLFELYSRLKENKYINQDTLEFWYTAFQDWLSENC